ncbi:MAG: YraN family protein [Bacteroidaceae bacterium]|nr:YraN family protein [Bacteroidaceae bacterium]
MAKHNDLGKEGEEATVRYLEGKGYVIRHRNWRYRHWELDIVAYKDGEIRVIEVKTRSSDNFKEPIEAVNHIKRMRIMKATNAYIKYFDLDEPVYFDIISLVGSDGFFKIEHIENAFNLRHYY